MPSDRKSNQDRVPEVDGLRALACLFVLVLHCYVCSGQPTLRIPLYFAEPNILRLVQFMNTGVNLFLILSGFCLFVAFAADGADARFRTSRFMIRRFWRLVPAYYAAIVFCSIMLWSYPRLTAMTGIPFQPTARLADGWSMFLHLTLMQSLDPRTVFEINGPFWTLGLEWHYYLVFPLMVWAFHRYGPVRTTVASILVMLGYRAAMGWVLRDAEMDVRWTWLDANIPGRIAEFALGMAAAWYVTRHTERWRWTTSALVGAAALVSAAVSMKTPPFSVFNGLGWGTVYVLLLMLTLRGPVYFGLAFASRPLAWIGSISYSVYLVHMPVLDAIGAILRQHFVGIPLFVMLLLTVGASTLLLASFWYRVFEKPFLRGMPSLRRKSTPSAVGPQAVEALESGPSALVPAVAPVEQNS